MTRGQRTERALMLDRRRLRAIRAPLTPPSPDPTENHALARALTQRHASDRQQP